MFLNIYYQILTMTKQQLRESLRKIIKEELEENKNNQFLNQFDLPPSDEAILGDIIGQIEEGKLNEIAVGKALRNLTIGGLVVLSSILSAKAQAPQKDITSYNKIELMKSKDSSLITQAKETFGGEIGKLIADAGLKPLNSEKTIWGDKNSEVFGDIGLIKKDGKIRYINLTTKELGDPVGLGQEVEEWIKNNYLKRINTLLPKTTPTSVATSSLRETIRNIIRQTLAENQPATAPSKPKEKPAVAPGKPSTDKPKPRRPLGNPDTGPVPAKASTKTKATMTEAEMLARIIKRFKSKG